MNWYKHHINDWDAATAHLSMLEDAAYSRLVRLYYRREAPIPTDITEACRLVRARSDEERAAVETVLREFFELREDGWHQRRCDHEIERATAQRHANQITGRLGGRPRKQPETGAGDEPIGNRSGSAAKPTENRIGSEIETGTKPNHNPSQTPDTKTPRHQDKDKKEQRPRQSRFQLADLPDEWRAFCSAERPDLDTERTFARFGDYWRAQPGQRGVRVDWLATWRNWVRNERPADRQSKASPASAREARNRAAVDAFVSEGKPNAAT